MTPDADPAATPPTSPEPAPAAPAPPAAASAPAPAAPAQGTGLQPTIAAALACVIAPPIGGILFLVLEKKDKFVRFYAMQAVLLGGLGFILWMFLQIAAVILSPLGFLGTAFIKLLSVSFSLISLVGFVVWIVMIVKALSNKEWEIPYLGAFARKQLESGKFGGQ
jgi:uncharacterized membrane protein